MVDSQDFFKVPSRSAVRKAGHLIKESLLGDAHPEPLELERAYHTLFEWRACHACVLNAFQTVVRQKLGTLNLRHALVAQRLKRMPSIIAKLTRFPKMQADRMYDVIGVRVILKNVTEVDRFHEALRHMKSRHTLQEPVKDYIRHPKDDGYRSLHLVFSYHHDRHPQLDGLKLELQLRTCLQHSWATAVETLGMLRQASFKTGQGDEATREFFRLSGALFSWQETGIMPDYCRGMTPQDLCPRIRDLDRELNLMQTLNAVVVSAQYIEKKQQNFQGFHVLELNAQQGKTQLTAFLSSQLPQVGITSY